MEGQPAPERVGQESDWAIDCDKPLVCDMMPLYPCWKGRIFFEKSYVVRNHKLNNIEQDEPDTIDVQGSVDNFVADENGVINELRELPGNDRKLELFSRVLLSRNGNPSDVED